MDDFDDKVSRRQRRVDLLYEDDPEIFAGDEIDEADAIARSMPTTDQLAFKSKLRQHRSAGLKNEAPHARTNPPTALMAVIGNQVMVPPNPMNPLDAAKWQGDDAETTTVTVTFGPVTAPQLTGEIPTGKVLRPVGVVQWGTRGSTVDVEVDIGQGVQFSVAGSMVYLRVTQDPVDPLLGPGSVLLSGMIGFHSVFRTQHLTRTKYVPALGASIPRPKFAQSVVLVNDAAAFPAEQYQLDFLDSAGTTQYNVLTTPGAFMATPIPLAGNIFYVLVTPVGAAHAAELIFNLAL